tara:strand:- start:15 stop:632 length:618 start_codon:yes stop_codon:yes gene_type:complete
MNNNENNIDWFLEVEKNAKELVSELESIKKSSVIYDEAKNSLTKISNELINIAETISFLIESLKLNTNKSNETLIQSNELLSEQIKTNEENLKQIDSSLTQSIKTSTNKTNKTLLQSNEILLEQIKTSELSLKKIQSSFKKFQNEIINELEATKTFIHEDNYDLMTSIQNRINDKFEKFNIRFVIGFTIIVVMTAFSIVLPYLQN